MVLCLSSQQLKVRHVLPFHFQYVSKNGSELHQRAAPKQAPVLTLVDERDDSVERQLERIPTIHPAAAVPQPEGLTGEKTQSGISTSKPAAEDVAARDGSHVAAVSDEAPHVHVESEEARQARLDRQWKLLKADVSDLPDVYARLAKIKLTGRVQSLNPAVTSCVQNQHFGVCNTFFCFFFQLWWLRLLQLALRWPRCPLTPSCFLCLLWERALLRVLPTRLTRCVTFTLCVCVCVGLLTHHM